MLHEDRFLKRVFLWVGIGWIIIAAIFMPLFLSLHGHGILFITKYFMYVVFPFYFYFSLKLALRICGAAPKYKDRLNNENPIKSFTTTYLSLFFQDLRIEFILFGSGVAYLAACYYLLSWLEEWIK